MSRRFPSSRGSALVEFQLVTVLLVMTLISVVELSRYLIVYNAINNAARVGVRYAITHGANRTGTGATGPSGPGANPAQVLSVINGFAAGNLLTTASMTVSVTYPNGTNSAGSPVKVRITYPFNPLTGYFPITSNVGTTSQGIIVY